jgi:uncharacterized membrane protein YqjE
MEAWKKLFGSQFAMVFLYVLLLIFTVWALQRAGGHAQFSFKFTI